MIPVPVTLCTTVESVPTVVHISGAVEDLTVEPGSCVIAEGGNTITLKANRYKIATQKFFDSPVTYGKTKKGPHTFTKDVTVRVIR
jgi:hypothetical protein